MKNLKKYVFNTLRNLTSWLESFSATTILKLFRKATFFVSSYTIFSFVIITASCSGQNTNQSQDTAEEVITPVLYKNLKAEYVIAPNSFSSSANFNKYWRNFYPWGPDHNGTARMNEDNIKLEDGVLKLSANRITADEGFSLAKPHLKIAYHSGAISAIPTITISDSIPQIEVSGYFKAPSEKGTWPAFWLTATKGWPPEIDILEFKGSDLNWQNTFSYPKNILSKKIKMLRPAQGWHQYKVILKKLDVINISIEYFLDNRLTAIHKGVNYLNKPMWLIINLQMEGISGSPGPMQSEYFAKEIIVKKWRKTSI
ncbi:glycoside hydrolase family 16 protein [Mucilaginibacter glaciei]|uniref:Family 16 glycosylhydrolase n=1 Tax=Mucilaginibacter glaciei TaxID=2772109 RepID=A0A926NST4_9SPHI|nr:family 16 glycosylhydrolase [Mucilaginibacter glaciei]MBD1393315.1 family 16 glycosylhydrolase [Mucilaginibacter glaciei]